MTWVGSRVPSPCVFQDTAAGQTLPGPAPQDEHSSAATRRRRAGLTTSPDLVPRCLNLQDVTGRRLLVASFQLIQL